MKIRRKILDGLKLNSRVLMTKKRLFEEKRDILKEWIDLMCQEIVAVDEIGNVSRFLQKNETPCFLRKFDKKTALERSIKFLIMAI